MSFEQWLLLVHAIVMPVGLPIAVWAIKEFRRLIKKIDKIETIEAVQQKHEERITVLERAA